MPDAPCDLDAVPTRAAAGWLTPPGITWAEEVLAQRAEVLLAAARQGGVDDAMAGLVGDLVEAAAALALAVLGEYGALRAEPVASDPNHAGWVVLEDAVRQAEPNIVRLADVRQQRGGAERPRWAVSTVVP